jgi:hypothetical protein
MEKVIGTLLQLLVANAPKKIKYLKNLFWIVACFINNCDTIIHLPNTNTKNKPLQPVGETVRLYLYTKKSMTIVNTTKSIELNHVTCNKHLCM